MIIRKDHIKQIMEDEHRNLDRFDAEFDLPEHLLPEFPPPIFMSAAKQPTTMGLSSTLLP